MRIKPARFVHVVYRTRRFEEMLRWYDRAAQRRSLSRIATVFSPEEATTPIRRSCF